VVQLIGPRPREADRHGSALGAFTAGTCLTDALRAALADRGIGDVAVEAVPLPMQ
jgi:glutamate racemase